MTSRMTLRTDSTAVPDLEAALAERDHWALVAAARQLAYDELYDRYVAVLRRRPGLLRRIWGARG